MKGTEKGLILQLDLGIVCLKLSKGQSAMKDVISVLCGMPSVNMFKTMPLGLRI